MRTAFIQALCEVAQQDERIWLITGDLGYTVLEVFAERFPGRFLNAGVAEQNMTGLAAGLALCGKTVFTYSIANFPIMRCLEQIRNDVCYHNLNVKIVAVGGGLAYGSQGYTHQGVEDLAVMRVLPHITVVAPGDPVETKLATQAIAAMEGPCYLRLGKAREPVVHQSEPPFQIGKAIRLRQGEDIALLSTGGTLQMTVAAADALGQQGYSVEVLSLPTLHPFDEEAVIQAARRTKVIVTVEEHGLGGLASIVAEVLATRGMGVRLVPLRLRREPVKCAGSQSFLQAENGLSVERVVEAAKWALASPLPATCGTP